MDVKQILYSWCGKKKCGNPNYDFSTGGPRHRQRFKCEVGRLFTKLVYSRRTSSCRSKIKKIKGLWIWLPSKVGMADLGNNDFLSSTAYLKKGLITLRYKQTKS